MKLWYSLLISVAATIASLLFAQERTSSLQQYEVRIESKIHQSLQHYLEPKDYVLRVSAQGNPYIAEQISTNDNTLINEGLPGFADALPQTNKSSITTQIKTNSPTLWEVSSLQVDLIMHKEIAPSLQEYLLRSVPLIAGLIPERGDAFNFLPITPNEIQQPTENQTEEAQETPIEEPIESLKWYEQIYQQIQQYGIWGWIAIGAFILLFLLLVILLVKRSNPEQDTSQSTQNIPDLQKHFEQEKQKFEQERTKQMQDFFAQEEQIKLSQEIVKELIGHEDWKMELINEWTTGSRHKDKFPLLICALGTFTARSLFSKTLGTSAYSKFEQSANQLTPQDSDIAAILKEVHDFLNAKSIDSPEKYQQDPFSFLNELSASQVGFLIKDEPIRIKAIVLSRLGSDAVSQVLKKMTPEEQSQVLIKIGNLHELPLDLIEGVAMDLSSKLSHLPDDNTASFDGVDLLADLMTFTDDKTRQSMLKQLRLNDQKLSSKVEEKSFAFESIPFIPKESLTEVVRRMNSDDVLTAFVGADREIQKTIILCFNEKARPNMVSQIKSKNPTPDEIDEKKRLFVAQIRLLADEGKIKLKDVYMRWKQQKSEQTRVA